MTATSSGPGDERADRGRRRMQVDRAHLLDPDLGAASDRDPCAGRCGIRSSHRHFRYLSTGGFSSAGRGAHPRPWRSNGRCSRWNTGRAVSQRQRRAAGVGHPPRLRDPMALVFRGEVRRSSGTTSGGGVSVPAMSVRSGSAKGSTARDQSHRPAPGTSSRAAGSARDHRRACAGAVPGSRPSLQGPDRPPRTPQPARAPGAPPACIR